MKLELTRDEIALVIHSVQRTIINLEKWNDNGSEILRKHRVLIKTLLELEHQINTEAEENTNHIESYK